MTTISTAPALDMEFLQPEDNMELASSPHIQQDDLDLDLDTTYEPQMAPEDSMVEDAFDHDSLEVAEQFDDDVMYDEDSTVQHFPDAASDLNMETRHEAETALEDEDILYEDDEILQDSELVQPTNDFANAGTQSIDKQNHSASLSSDIEVSEAHAEDNFVFAEEEPVVRSDLSGTRDAANLEEFNQQPVEEEYQDPTSTRGSLETPEDVDGETRADIQEPVAESLLDLEDNTTITNPEVPTEDQKASNAGEQDTIDDANTSATEAAALEQQTTPFEAQDVALHTVKVIYQQAEICLFPPHTDEGAETFFLSDHGLAHESIDMLLVSCREVLADTIGDDDELVLDVPSLGLHISEDSKYAAEITLSQILDVYLKLSQNDGIHQIEPLYCNLSTRVCLASQYAYLTSAAQEGKTISEVIAKHMDSPEFEAAEERPEYDASTEHNTDHVDVADASLPAPERSMPADAYDEEEVADAETTDTVAGQKDDHLEITEQADQTEPVENVAQRYIIDERATNESAEAEPPTGFSHDFGADDAGIEPASTEYHEDIDEVANEGLGHSLEEQLTAAEQHVETFGATDESASSGTIEAEITADEETHIEETQIEEIFDQNSNHSKYDDGSDQHAHESNRAPAQQDHIRTFETAAACPILNEHDDDILDLESEDQEQSSVHQLDFDEKVDETEFRNVEDNENLFDEDDASTDETLDHTQGDDEDDLDLFLPAATPAKTRSTKRKVDADDEDEIDLLDTETPDKKRRRPS